MRKQPPPLPKPFHPVYDPWLTVTQGRIVEWVVRVLAFTGLAIVLWLMWVSS